MKKFLTVFTLLLFLIASITVSFKVIIPSMKYSNAKELLLNNQFDEAYDIFNDLGNFKNSKEMLKETKYLKAEYLENKKDFIGAYQLYEMLDAYKNSNEKKINIYVPYLKSLINSKQIGETFSVGKFDDYDIEWIVLEKKDNKVLAITKSCIRSKPFNNDLLGTTYDESTLRIWVHNGFLSSVFNSDELSILANEKECKIINDVTNRFGKNCGKNTFDNAFLLSTEEAEKYFNKDDDRIAYYLNGENTAWWLRSTGDSVVRTAIVGIDGDIYYEGITDNSEIGVRPAIWIDVKI